MDITSRIIANNRKKINEAYRRENLREDDSKDIQRQTVNKRRSEDPDYPMKTLQKDRKDELTPGTADVNEDHMDDCKCANCKNMNESKELKKPVSNRIHGALLDHGFTFKKGSGGTHHYEQEHSGHTFKYGRTPNGNYHFEHQIAAAKKFGSRNTGSTEILHHLDNHYGEK